jgi:hypothetical protein
MDFLERANPDYLRARELGNSYNDWLTPGDDDTPPELLATAYWAHDAALMAEIADATGRAGEAAGYRALLAKLRSAFIDAFVAADGQVASGTQTAYVLALHMDLIPDDLRAAAAERLVAAIRAADWHLTTGFAGVGYLLPVLSSAGYDVVAYRLLEQDTMPSWRYMTGHGATTIWERWDGWTAEHGFASPWMNSFNHYSLGCCSGRTPAGHWTGPAAPTPPSGARSGPAGSGTAAGSRTGRSCRPTSRPPSASPAATPPRSATPRVTRLRRSPVSPVPRTPRRPSSKPARGRTSSPAPR